MGRASTDIDPGFKDESLLPLTVCVSPFYDESAALPDMILPGATHPERRDLEDMVSPAHIPEYDLRQPMVEPLGEARDFADVTRHVRTRGEIGRKRRDCGHWRP